MTAMLTTIVPKSSAEETAKLRADLFNSKVMHYFSKDMFYRTDEEKKALLLEREHLCVYFATKNLSFKIDTILMTMEEVNKEIITAPKHMEIKIPTFAEIRGDV